MSNLINKLQEVSADEILREKYNAREKARLDYKSAMSYAENRGIEKGIEKGIEQGELKKAREMAKELIRDNVDTKLIAKYTRLTVEEIEEISRKMKN